MSDYSAIRILLLDDEPFMLKLLAHLLTELGFTQITCCEKGQDALYHLDEPSTVPHLILLDLNMPEMDGVEFIRHLVERKYGGNLILVSGENKRILQSAEKLIRAHDLAVLGHLAKPVQPEALTILLKALTTLPHNQPRLKPVAYSPDELATGLRNHELVNYYQPKVSVKTGDVVGVETLVRWCHPKAGVVYPDQFIHISEAHKLIDQLTSIVLQEALSQTKLWLDAGITLDVSVNLSMDNLASLEFADIVESKTILAGIAPQTITLEITESRLMEDFKSALDILTRLRLKRFHLSIDDFGTGHSSLTQLRDLPFDELKVDKSFVHGASTNPTTRAIYDASLKLAKQLDMVVVAEGVEDESDWKLLRDTGCDLAQGYFIGKPMPAAELPAWMASWAARYKALLNDKS